MKIIQTVHHASSIDSLEQSESNFENLRFISGHHKWVNSNNNIRVENSSNFNDAIYPKTFSIVHKNKYEIEEDEDLSHSSRTNVSLNHFDVQLQVNNGQLQQIIRYGVFSSILPNDINTFKINQSSQTIEPEMDMEGGNGRRNGSSNFSSQQSNGNQNNNNDGGYRRNRQTNESGGSGGGGSGDGNGFNRNNNNSKR